MNKVNKDGMDNLENQKDKINDFTNMKEFLENAKGNKKKKDG